MQIFDRRTVLVGGAVTAALGLRATPASAADVMAMDAPSGKDTTVGPGIVMRVYGESPSLIAGYKTVRLLDFIMQPGSKTADDPMPNPMVCHMLAGELRVVQNGVDTTKKKGDVWTCTTGTHEVASNESKAEAIMRMTFLIPA
ncbi:MAG: hypothetical protein NVS2B8_02390 [Vulcanimicrobiaceae bacterium]